MRFGLLLFQRNRKGERRDVGAVIQIDFVITGVGKLDLVFKGAGKSNHEGIVNDLCLGRSAIYQ